MNTRKKRQSGRPFARFSLFLVIGAGILAVFLLSSGGVLYAAHLENNDTFCASCHTEPESTFVDRSQAGAPVDLASSHAGKEVHCIQCHSGDGVAGRVDAMTIGASDLLAFKTGNFHAPAIVTVPIDDANCLKCHSDVSNTQDFQEHFHAFLPKWQELDANAATCVDCHEAHVTGGLTQISFLTESTTTAVCQRCHSFVGER